MSKLSLWVVSALLTVGCAGEDPPIASPLGPSPIGSQAASFSLSGVVSSIDADGCLFPLRGARIRIDAASGGVFETVTDGNGRYAIHGLPVALCEITVEGNGYEPIRRSLQLSGNAVMNFELVPQR